MNQQKEIADAIGVTQHSVSRYLRTLLYIGFIEKDGRNYIEGPKAPQYLQHWAVILLDSA